MLDQTITDHPEASRGAVASIPSRIGRFTLVRELGRGSSGLVFEACDPAISYPIAIKVLRSFDSGRVTMFKNEARRASLLRHPNIVVPFELFHEDGHWLFSMELIHGKDLISFIRDQAPQYRLAAVENCFRQLVQAVAALHDAELLHLDVKPANVLVREDGHLYLLDFGVAQQLGGMRSKTPLGTPAYWSPEQARGDTLGPASDWYSLGVMLYEACTGSLPGASAERLGDAEWPEHIRKLSSELLSPDDDVRQSAAERLGGGNKLVSGRRSFFGRTSELDHLSEAAARAASGQAQRVELVGDSGVGKSALLAEFLRRLRVAEPEAIVLTARCFERESVGFKGIDTLVEELTDRALALTQEERAALGRAGLNEAAVVFPTLERLVRAEPRPAARDAPQLRRRAFAGVRALFLWFARERLVVLALDDIHWADADSLALLAAIFGGLTTEKLLFVSSGREAGSSRVDAAWSESFAHRERWPVAPLDATTAEELAGSLVEEKARAHAIALASSGNPFLIEEMAKQDSALDGIAADDLLAALIHQRCQDLSSEARRLVRLVALFGRPMPESVAWLIVDPGPRQPLLAELRRQGLLRVGVAPKARVLEPWHWRVLELAGHGFDSREDVGLHRELAQALGVVGAPPAERGHHLELCGEVGEAFECFVLAAEEAAQTLSFERAARFYERALATNAAGPTVSGQLMVKCAECLFNAGKSREAGRSFSAARGRLVGHEAQEATARAAEAYLLAGSIDEGFDVVRDLYRGVAGHKLSSGRVGLAIVGDLMSVLIRGTKPAARENSDARTVLEIDLYWRLAKGLIYVLPLEATHFLLKALRLSLRAGDAARVARCLGLLGAGMFMQIPLLSRCGVSYLEQARRIANGRNDPYLEAMAEVWGAFSQVYAGRWLSMLERSRAGASILARLDGGVTWEVSIAEGLEAWAYQFLGRLAQSGEHAEVSMIAARERGDVYGEILFSQYLAYAHLAAGRLGPARALAAIVDEKWTKRSYTVQHFYSMLLAAMADLMVGDVAGAVTRFTNDRAAFRNAGGTRAPMSRIDFALLEARIVLNASAEESKRLRSWRSLASLLSRERRSDCAGHAAWIRAAGTTREHGEGHASELWTEAASLYAAADMELHAASARFHQGLERNEALAQMQSLGVGDAFIWLRSFMPDGLRRRASASKPDQFRSVSG